MKRVIRDAFAVTLRTQEGHKFRGEFGDPNAFPRPRKEITNFPHRVLAISRKVDFVQPGQLVTFTNTGYLLCGQHELTDVRMYLAVQVSHTLLWRRVNEIIDPVTRLPRDSSEIILDEALPVAMEPGRTIEELKFAQVEHRIFTAADVRVGDWLNEWKVATVTDVFGLRMIEVS